ncbi:hypothetical protein [Nocardioides nitrophenolicus]|uniref:hypothetical protein n=1 Tax=Nocardioides nitrophenolicus TaxID=60489 RepID=UPI0019589C57|nr:hypothetical protein [Nocardioides nitrophenolicus]MBM7520177.1 hypothetical protein [Nocardioides nitrophenolicus]
MGRARGRLLAALGIIAAGALGASGSAESSAADTARTLSRAVAELSTWWGSTADRQAAEVVVTHRLNGSYDDCLAERGLPGTDWRGSVPRVGSSSPLGGVVWLVEPGFRPFSADLDVNATNAATEDRRNHPPSRPADQVRAEDDCLERTRGEGPSDDEVEELRLPAVVERLREAWTDALAAAYDDLGSPEDFVACVDEQQVPELRGRSLAEAARLAAEVERELGIGTGELTEEKRESFRAWEAPIAAAIETCVAPHHVAAVAALPGLVASFERAHADEIADAEEAWARRRAEAASLG